MEHHIRGRDIPNANKQFNLASVCPCCHDDIHIGIEVVLEGWFSTTSGRKLFWHRKGEPEKMGPGIIPPLYDE